MEKYMLRLAFKDDNVLPPEVLWRRKEAFSDGCSSEKKSWYTIIQNHVNDILSDDDFDLLKQQYTHNKPVLKESLYYRLIFDKYYKNFSNRHILFLY